MAALAIPVLSGIPILMDGDTGCDGKPLCKTFYNFFTYCCSDHQCLFFGFQGINSVLNIGGSLESIFWPLIIVSFTITLLHFVLAITAGICIWKQLRLGWWLAGIYFCTRIISSVLGLFQLFFVKMNDQPLYLDRPELLYSTIGYLIFGTIFLIIVYTGKVRNHLQISEENKLGNFGKLLFFAFLVSILQVVLFYLASFVMASQ